MRFFTFFLFSLFTISLGFSQRKVEDNLFSLNFLAPGATYEFAVGNESTINANLNLGFFYRDSDFFGDEGFGVYPGIELQYRLYNNFKRREAKGKNTFGNMANYIAPTVSLQTGEALIGDLGLSSDYFGAAGVVYGFQRTGKRGFQFNFMTGPALFFSDSDTEFGILLNIRLGFVLGAKKKFNN